MDSAPPAVLPCSHGNIRSSAAQRNPRRRFLPRDRGADVHPDPVRHGRRGDQDRESRRRRRHAQGRGAAPGRREPLLHDLQPRQEERGARLHQARGPGGGEKAPRIVRRAGPELPARRAQQIRPRLREPSREASAADLSVDLGLRPDRALVGPAGLRSRAAGRVGHDERQRRGQRRGPAARHRHRRHHDGDPFGGGDQRGAVCAHQHGPRPARRSGALRHGARRAGQHGLLLPDRRRAAAACRQRPFRLGAQQLVRYQQRQDLHGGGQPEAVHRHLQGAGPSRMGDRSALCRARRSRRQQARADAHDGRRARRPTPRRTGRRSSATCRPARSAP